MGEFTDGMIAGLREFPGDLRELLTTPRTLIIFVFGVCLLIFVSTNQLMFSIFPWVILFLGYIGYGLFRYRKAGYRLDRKRKAVLAVACAVIIIGSIYSYEVIYVNSIRLARIPPDILAKNQWSRFPEQDSSETLGAYLVRIEVRAFRYLYTNPASPPYPGAIWLVTAKTVFLPDNEFMKNEIEKQINSFSMDGLSIDKASRTEGREKLGNGHEAQYAEYQALLSTSGAGFFGEVRAGAKIKIRAEWWACGEQGTAIIALGAAQWGINPQTDLFGRLIPGAPDDLTTVYSIERIIYNIQCA